MKKLALFALLAPTLAFAEPTLNLSAGASSKVTNDEMVVTLSIELSGPDSAPITDAVVSALDEALKEAKAVRGVNARLSSVSTQPAWDQNRKNGWVTQGGLSLNSQDMKALSLLTEKLSRRLQLAGVHFRLSDEKRTAEERRLLQAAADNFNSKAAEAAKAFGYKSYTLGEVTVGQSGYASGPRPMMMEMASAKAARFAALPTDGGDSEVSVNVVGKITLLKN
jgi:predicted secreted protein